MDKFLAIIFILSSILVSTQSCAPSRSNQIEREVSRDLGLDDIPFEEESEDEKDEALKKEENKEDSSKSEGSSKKNDFKKPNTSSVNDDQADENVEEDNDEEKEEGLPDWEVFQNQVALTAVDYVQKFHSKNYRSESETNKQMFKKGQNDFYDHYRRKKKIRVKKEDFRGYIYGGDGIHILSGVDCSAFLEKVINISMGLYFGAVAVEFPLMLTHTLFDISVSYYNALKDNPNLTGEDLRKSAFVLHHKRLIEKKRVIDKSPRGKTDKNWMQRHTKFFDFIEYVPSAQEARKGDIVFFPTKTNVKYRESGHAYFYLAEAGRNAGVGAHSRKTGLGFIGHPKKTKNKYPKFYLRANFSHLKKYNE